MERALAHRIKIGRNEVVLLAVVAALVAGAFLADGDGREPISSSETRFVEHSASGLQIVPASAESCVPVQGPSGGWETVCTPAYNHSDLVSVPPAGSCSYYRCTGGDLYFVNDGDGRVSFVSAGSCWAASVNPPPGTGHQTVNFCLGNALYHQNDYSCGWNKIQDCPLGCARGACLTVAPQCTTQYFCRGDDQWVNNSCTGESRVQACAWGCSAGGCLTPPPPTGNITATPSIVRSGNTSVISWSAQNVESCTVTEDNPDINDAWAGATGSKTSSALAQQTVYTLRCTGEDGSQFTDSAKVNIIPVWEEL